MTRSGRCFSLLSALVALVLATGPGAGPAEAVTEIQWWHAHTAALGEWVNDLADGFNKSQSEYKVVAVYKGSYSETMTGAIAAFRAKQHPQIVQVFEVGTATMMAAKGAIKPVYELMADAGEKFDPHRHQAMTTVESDKSPNTVVHVLQKGYMLNDRVLRPALVTVAKAPSG